jgi:hypothetical protein
MPKPVPWVPSSYIEFRSRMRHTPHKFLECVGRPLKKSMVGGNSDCNDFRRPGATMMCVSMFFMLSCVGYCMSCTGFLRAEAVRVRKLELQIEMMYLLE